MIKIRLLKGLLATFLLSLSFIKLYGYSVKKCQPLIYDEVMRSELTFHINSSNDTLCSFRLILDEDFKGNLSIDKFALQQCDPGVIAVSNDTLIHLQPMLDNGGRICEFVSDSPIQKGMGFRIIIPTGILKICPEMEEVDEIDLDEELLTSLSVAGAWHKAGKNWKGQGMFSVIDDDSLDGQIAPYANHPKYKYGYWSLLYPLLESLDLKGNLAVEGRKIGIDYTPVKFNNIGRTLVRLQDEKGWNLLSHSMECLGEIDNNWMVDSLDSPLAKKILQEGPNNGQNQRTVSVYDMKTGKQYWPNSDSSGWEETPSRFIKPYIGDYSTGKNVMYNPDFDVDWHWGETKSRAEEYGMNYVGFVTHNSTSSHALVSELLKVFPFGLSDPGTLKATINYPPMLSSAVRSGLEGQLRKGYNGDSKDNTFNDDHFRSFCAQVDEAVENGGWIIFNLHTYRDCWKNSLPGALVSEGGSYPDEWEIPMKGLDSANDPLTPPSHLGISDWREWYPCPGTRLEMMWKVLKYAKERGLKPVTCSEGFRIMGNKVSVGYFNNGYKFGKDLLGPLIDSDEIYPHYIVSATDEISYYNPLVSNEYTIDLDMAWNVDYVVVGYSGKFIVNGDNIVWSTPDPSGVSLKVIDLTGTKIAASSTNRIMLDSQNGVYIICAVRSGSVIGTVKVVR